jgi:hypothetical protein
MDPCMRTGLGWFLQHHPDAIDAPVTVLDRLLLLAPHFPEILQGMCG